MLSFTAGRSGSASCLLCQPPRPGTSPWQVGSSVRRFLSILSWGGGGGGGGGGVFLAPAPFRAWSSPFSVGFSPLSLPPSFWQPFSLYSSPPTSLFTSTFSLFGGRSSLLSSLALFLNFSFAWLTAFLTAFLTALPFSVGSCLDRLFCRPAFMVTPHGQRVASPAFFAALPLPLAPWFRLVFASFPLANFFTARSLPWPLCVCRLLGRSICRPLDRSVCRFLGRSMCRLLDRSVCRLLDRYVYRLLDRSVCRLLDHSACRLLDRSVCRFLDRSGQVSLRQHFCCLPLPFVGDFLCSFLDLVSSAGRLLDPVFSLSPFFHIPSGSRLRVTPSSWVFSYVWPYRHGDTGTACTSTAHGTFRLLETRQYLPQTDGSAVCIYANWSMK